MREGARRIIVVTKMPSDKRSVIMKIVENFLIPFVLLLIGAAVTSYLIPMVNDNLADRKIVDAALGRIATRTMELRISTEKLVDAVISADDGAGMYSEIAKNMLELERALIEVEVLNQSVYRGYFNSTLIKDSIVQLRKARDTVRKNNHEHFSIYDESSGELAQQIVDTQKTIENAVKNLRANNVWTIVIPG